MEEVKEIKEQKIAISEFVEKSLLSFGIDVNTNRQLSNLYDGLKPSYRRIIYTAMELGNKMKTVTLSGTCVSRYHPHGDASLLQPISNLVNSGVLGGNGNHGMKMFRGDNLPPAAPRYTECWISDKWKAIFKDLLPYVPYVPSELEGFNEPLYLPSPVPLCFLTGSLGIGFGVNTRTPVFSCESMLDAYFNDDPKLLKPSIDIELDYDNSELDRLWNTGIGNVTYSFHCKWGNSKSGQGVYISGDPTLFKPSLSVLEKLVTEGKIFINDETDRTGQKIFISRNYNIKSISWEYLLDLCKSASTKMRTYRLTVCEGDKAYLIPLKEWLKVSVENYLRLVDVLKSDKISKYEFDRLVYLNLPRVAEYLFNHRNSNNEEISNELELDIEIIRAILQKSINTLKNTETTEKVNSIMGKINYYKSLNPSDYLKTIIKQFN